MDIFEAAAKDDGTGSIRTILSDSYYKVLAPRHSFLVKKAVGLALMFSGAGNVAKNVEVIFGHKEFNDEAKNTILITINLMKIIWKGGHNFYEKNGLLGLK